MSKHNKREIIKNIAIVFLVIMLILTFFSNTIMNRTLPEVSTQTITEGTVSTQVRGEGVIEAEDPYNVVLDETRKIAGVNKHVGDHVEIGDVIYKLEGEQSEELTTAKNDLDTLKSDYDLAIIESGLSQSEVAAVEAGVTVSSGTILSTLESKDKEIAALKDQLADKEKKYSEADYQAQQASGNTNTSTSDYSDLEAAVENARKALENSQNVYNGYVEAKNIVDTKNEAVANYHDAYDRYYNGYKKDDGTQVDGAKDAYDKAEAAYDAAKADYQSKTSAYETAAADFVTKSNDYTAKAQIVENADPNTDPNYNDYVNARDAAKTAMDAAEATKNSAETAMKTASSAKDKAEENMNNAKAEKDNALSALNTAEAAMKEAEKLEAVAPSEEDLKKAEEDVKAKQSALNKAEEDLKNKKNSDSSNSNKNKENQDNLNKQAHNLSVEVADLKAKIEKLQAERDAYLTEEKTKINLEKKYQEILKQDKKVKDLEAKAIGGEIKSPVAGEITAVNYTAGEKVEAGSTVAVIQIDGKGFKTSFPVTAKQAKSVKVGDEVEIINAWYYGDMEANLVAIQPDKNNTRDGKLLVFSLNGTGINPGQSITLSVGQKSSSYDLIVPISALHEDNNGNFVYKLETRSTPFGSRYIAKRVDVRVLAKDDKVAAIDADIYAYEYVITNSSKDFNNKDQVKLAE